LGAIFGGRVTGNVAYADHLKPAGKRTSEKERSQFGPKFQMEVVVSHQPFFLSKKLGWTFFMRHKNGYNYVQVSFVLSQSTPLTD